jgi:hypothetical protein
VAEGVRNDYQPVGYRENFWIEKISTEALRLARLLGHEQTVMMSWSNPFWEPSADRVLRFQTTANRRLAEAIEQLERLQAKRKAETASLNLPRPGGERYGHRARSIHSGTGDQLEEAATIPYNPKVAERTHRGRETSVNRPSGPLRTIRNRTGRVLMVRNKQERWNEPTPNAG